MNDKVINIPDDLEKYKKSFEIKLIEQKNSYGIAESHRFELNINLKYHGEFKDSIQKIIIHKPYLPYRNKNISGMVRVLHYNIISVPDAVQIEVKHNHYPRVFFKVFQINKNLIIKTETKAVFQTNSFVESGVLKYVLLNNTKTKENQNLKTCFQNYYGNIWIAGVGKKFVADFINCKGDIKLNCHHYEGVIEGNNFNINAKTNLFLSIISGNQVSLDIKSVRSEILFKVTNSTIEINTDFLKICNKKTFEKILYDKNVYLSKEALKNIDYFSLAKDSNLNINSNKKIELDNIGIKSPEIKTAYTVLKADTISGSIYAENQVLRLFCKKSLKANIQAFDFGKRNTARDTLLQIESPYITGKIDINGIRRVSLSSKVMDKDLKVNNVDCLTIHTRMNLLGRFLYLVKNFYGYENLIVSPSKIKFLGIMPIDKNLFGSAFK